MPSLVFTSGDNGLYSYLSDGTKVEVCGYDDNEPVRYRGSLVYNDGTFESASFGGGRIVGTNNGANSESHYFLTDHLGSTRVVAKVTPTGRQDLDRKDYYPFGKAWAQPSMPTSDNRYTFSGKEQQHLRDQVINYADFNARFYDSDGVTFFQQDPLLEMYFSIGAYNYCAGNPVRLKDPDGRFPIDTVWDAFNILYDFGAAVGNHFIGDNESAKSHWTDFGTDVAAFLIPYLPAGVSKIAKGTDKAVDAVKAGDKTIDAAKAVEKTVDAGKARNKVPNPYSSKGKLDHQEKVKELMEKASTELRPRERIEQERKIHVDGSNRRPDVQIIGSNGKTRKIFEAEREPNSKRNKLREDEYDRLGIEYETYPVN